MASLGRYEVAAHVVQRPDLVERLDLAAAVADIPVDAECFLLGAGRTRMVPGQATHAAQPVERVGLAPPVAEVAENAQRLFLSAGRTRVVPAQDQYPVAAIFGVAVGPADARPGEGLPERLVHPVAHGYLMGIGPGRIAEVLDVDDQDGAVDSWRQHLRS